MKLKIHHVWSRYLVSIAWRSSLLAKYTIEQINRSARRELALEISTLEEGCKVLMKTLRTA